MTTRNAVNGSLILLTAIVLAGCNHADASSAKIETTDTPVRVESITTTSTAPVIEASGVLAPREELRLSFKIGGVVGAVLVDEGQQVRAGQVIARLDGREIDAQVAKAKSALDKAERDLVRAQNLYKDSVATLEQVQNATTGAEVARSDYETARFNQRHATIVAPSSGIIMRKLVEPGELVASGQPIVLYGNDAGGNVVQVALPDRDAVRVRIGDRAEVAFDAMPGRTFAGTVSRTAGAANPQTGTYTVEIALTGTPRDLNGLIGRARIQPSARTSVVMVPIEAINEADGASAIVYALNDDDVTVRRVPVSIGFIAGERVAVVAGLQDVKRIVTTGSAYLTDGARVKVVQ